MSPTPLRSHHETFHHFVNSGVLTSSARVVIATELFPLYVDALGYRDLVVRCGVCKKGVCGRLIRGMASRPALSTENGPATRVVSVLVCKPAIDARP
jgi:hypothetical protein